MSMPRTTAPQNHPAGIDKACSDNYPGNLVTPTRYTVKGLAHVMTLVSSSAFQLKGNMMTLTMLHLINPDPLAIDKQLGRTISETPNLFRNMPVVLDLSRLADHTQPINFNEINHLLREYGLIPVGVTNSTEAQQQAARLSGLGILSNTSKPASKPSPSAKKAADAPSVLRPMVITQPVRSGQQVYAKNTDLIVQAPVSNGAEILADGHIHVYGSLRGRALAGVSGDQSARIFALSLHAELISIAGHYKLPAGLDAYDVAGPVSISLQDERLHIVQLNA